MDDPERYKYEIATMGCRTRVFENVNGEKTSLGRGNLSFTSITFLELRFWLEKNVEKEIARNGKDGKFHERRRKNNKKVELLTEEFQKRVWG